MSERHDKEHFDEYTDQNRAKHEILTSYYKPYLAILKGHAKRFHFIDAFAGPGYYDGKHPGSPLLALEVLANAKVLDRSTISCVEKLPEFSDRLRQAIAASTHKPALLAVELVRTGAFHTHVDEILSRDIYKMPGKAATFAFVDPCGVSGVRMKDLVRLLKLDFGEILLLFNSDGVNRLLGGLDKGTAGDSILIDLFGSKDRLESVRSEIHRRPSEREQVILEQFAAALRAESEAKYLLRFRFKAKSSERSSHYLIHCSNHPLGFKIMKSVMWVAGKSEQNPYGRLEFLSDHERGSVLDLFRIDLEDPKAKIQERVKASHCRVSEITLTWVYRPTDVLSSEVYKQLLLDLEATGRILVYDKENRTPSPASTRRKVHESPTLGDEYWLRAPG